jgi:hypothetical protein
MVRQLREAVPAAVVAVVVLLLAIFLAACGQPEKPACPLGNCPSPNTGQTTCCGTCVVALENDPMNCGACGNACPAGMICTGNACVAAPCGGQTCGTGSACCGGSCCAAGQLCCRTGDGVGLYDVYCSKTGYCSPSCMPGMCSP